MSEVLIEWDDAYALGIDDVDHEHRELIDLINRLYRKLQEDPKIDDVLDFLGEIHIQISAHFALEERMMRQSGYDGYAEHKEDHEKLLDEIRDIMDVCDSGQNLDATGLSERLNVWFSRHFKEMDARLHRHL